MDLQGCRKLQLTEAQSPAVGKVDESRDPRVHERALAAVESLLPSGMGGAGGVHTEAPVPFPSPFTPSFPHTAASASLWAFVLS